MWSLNEGLEQTMSNSMVESGSLALNRHMEEGIQRMREGSQCWECSDEVVTEGVEVGLRRTIRVYMSLGNNFDPFCSPYLPIKD